jgi:hypothetical protein
VPWPIAAERFQTRQLEQDRPAYVAISVRESLKAMPDTHHLAYEAADPAIHLLKQKQVLAVSCVIADSGISAHKAHVTDLPCASEEKHLVIDPPVVITVCRTRLAGEQKCNGGALGVLIPPRC